MKHAIMMTVHNNEEIIQRLLKCYDSKEIDFYIHVDKKAKQFRYDMIKGVCHVSKVYFVPQIKVYWSHYSQIEATLILLSEAIKEGYDYYHFISGVDIPLLNAEGFKSFFEENKGFEFVEFVDADIFKKNKPWERIQYHYCFLKNLRSSKVMIRKIQTLIRISILGVEKKLKINRCKSISEKIRYGSNWFSITREFAGYALRHKSWIEKYFKQSSCADEIFLQTILYNSDYYANNYYNQAERKLEFGRYVDWTRGEPYTFKATDIEELKSVRTSLFARKFDWNTDSKIIVKLFEFLEKGKK